MGNPVGILDVGINDGTLVGLLEVGSVVEGAPVGALEGIFVGLVNGEPLFANRG